MTKTVDTIQDRGGVVGAQQHIKVYIYIYIYTYICVYMFEVQGLRDQRALGRAWRVGGTEERVLSRVFNKGSSTLLLGFLLGNFI